MPDCAYLLVSFLCPDFLDELGGCNKDIVNEVSSPTQRIRCDTSSIRGSTTELLIPQNAVICVMARSKKRSLDMKVIWTPALSGTRGSSSATVTGGRPDRGNHAYNQRLNRLSVSTGQCYNDGDDAPPNISGTHTSHESFWENVSASSLLLTRGRPKMSVRRTTAREFSGTVPGPGWK